MEAPSEIIAGSIQTKKVVITGAGGLVGQNLALLLSELGCKNVVAIDKRQSNLELLARLNPDVRTVHADLAEPGIWEHEFLGADAVVILHAQIVGKGPDEFVRNNVEASRRVCSAMQANRVPFAVQVSSSVVHSRGNQESPGRYFSRVGSRRMHSSTHADVWMV
jgi:nucleoside-diphosphate-sugar epimerase